VSHGPTPALCATLADLRAQRTARPLEILVVDTAPAGAAGADLPGARVLPMPGAALAHARRAALAACGGELAACLGAGDRVGPAWLEGLLAPLADPRVAAVAGAWLPAAAETAAQRLAAGRLDPAPAVAGPEWLAAQPGKAPPWAEGALGNCALRLAALRDPAAGLPDPWLGPGTPAGAGDDHDLFYRLIRRGHSLAYEPRAYATRRPPEDWPALARQARARGRGRASFALAAAARDGDGRPLAALARDLAGAARALPGRLRATLRGRGDGSLRLGLEELSGALAAPIALLQARHAGPPPALSLTGAPARPPHEHDSLPTVRVRSDR
jgi:hypothetical protein